MRHLLVCLIMPLATVQGASFENSDSPRPTALKNAVGIFVFPPISGILKFGLNAERLFLGVASARFSVSLKAEYGTYKGDMGVADDGVTQRESYFNSDVALRVYVWRENLEGFYVGPFFGAFTAQLRLENTGANPKQFSYENHFKGMTAGINFGYSHAIFEKWLVGVDFLGAILPERPSVRYAYRNGTQAGNADYDYYPHYKIRASVYFGMRF